MTRQKWCIVQRLFSLTVYLTELSSVRIVAGAGIEPTFAAKETAELPLLHPASVPALNELAVHQ